MYDFQEDRITKWRQIALMLVAGMITAFLVTLGSAFLTLHRNCIIVYNNNTPDIVCSNDELLGWMLIVTGVFFCSSFAAYYKLFELQRLQTI